MIRKIYTFISLLRLPYKNIEYLNAFRVSRLKKLLIHAKNNVLFYRKKYSNIELDSIIMSNTDCIYKKRQQHEKENPKLHSICFPVFPWPI